jgi:malate dehydrogenase
MNFWELPASSLTGAPGAAGGIGQPLSLLLKLSPHVAVLHLYDVANTGGVRADVSHINTPARVRAFTGPAQLLDALSGCDLVVIPAGVPRKPGMTVCILVSCSLSLESHAAAARRPVQD